MTEREALKLALEALEKFRYHVANNYEINAAIAAAREVLAQPEYQSTADKSKLEKVPAKGTLLAQPEQEQIAVWLEKECDEQYLADRVRAGDYAKEKGHTENCAALADDIGKRHLSPSLVGVGESNSTSQPEQEPVEWYSVEGETRRYGVGMVECAYAIGRDEVVHVVTHESVKDVAMKHLPTQRTWVGLTDIDYAGLPLEQVGLVRWAEAKLKEKNT